MKFPAISWRKKEVQDTATAPRVGGLAKLFTPQENIERGALTILIVTVIGSILGVLKNSFLASRFGAGSDLDLYFAAFRIPDFLYNVFIFSTLSSSFLPIFSQLILQGKERVWEFLSVLMLLFTFILAGCAVLVVIFAPAVVDVLAPGFSFFQQTRLAQILRIIMLQPIFLAVSNLIAMTLQGFKRFFVSSLAPVFYNLGIIFGAVVLAQWSGIFGVVWGVVLGAISHCLIQLPTLFRLGFRFRLALANTMASLKEMMVLMLPRSFAIVAKNLLFFWVTIVASLLATGSLAVYNLADSIQTLPQTVFALSFITGAFPFLAGAWAAYQRDNNEEERNKFIRIFDRIAYDIVLVMIPAAIVMAVFSPVVVRLLFGYGSFSSLDQTRTAVALAVFCFGLPFQGLLMFLVRACFATKDTKNPFYSVLASSLLAIPAIWFLGIRFGVVGIAAAMGLEAVVNVIYLFFVLRKKLNVSRFPQFAAGIRKGLVIGLLAALPSGAVYYLLHFLLHEATALLFALELMAAGIVGCLSIFIVINVLKIIDLREMFQARSLE